MIRVFNTLARKKVPFKPRRGKQVNLFICGITPYTLSHIGHARTYVAYDVIVKYLRYSGYKVFYLQNVTDIDNKIISTANKKKIDPLKFSAKFTKEYLADMKSLGVDAVSKYAKATDHIKDIIRQVKKLQEKGYIYELDDGLYFEVSKFKEYGKLSKRKSSKLGEEDAFSRIDDSVGKKDPRDFCVWKFPKPGDPVWKTEIASGRPGWHIEDTAISEHFFGPQYDMHGGAKDLIFPHHEAEVTLMESYSGKKPLVKYWVHTGFLNVEGKKMSKSLGNFITIRDSLKKWDKDTLRFMFISTHYASAIDYSEKSLYQAKKNLDKIRAAHSVLKSAKKGKLGAKYLKKFKLAMDDNFNTPIVIALLLEMAKQKDSSIISTYKEIGKILGIDFSPQKQKPLSTELKKLVKDRELARKAKDWKLADKLRAKLAKKGILVEDSTKGTVWKRV